MQLKDADNGGRDGSSEFLLVKSKIKNVEEHIAELHVGLKALSNDALKAAWANLIAERLEKLAKFYEEIIRPCSKSTQGFWTLLIVTVARISKHIFGHGCGRINRIQMQRVVQRSIRHHCFHPQDVYQPKYQIMCDFFCICTAQFPSNLVSVSSNGAE